MERSNSKANQKPSFVFFRYSYGFIFLVISSAVSAKQAPRRHGVWGEKEAVVVEPPQCWAPASCSSARNPPSLSAGLSVSPRVERDVALPKELPVRRMSRAHSQTATRPGSTEEDTGFGWRDWGGVGI